MCALGRDRHSFEAARSEDVAKLVKAAHFYGPPGFEDRLIRAIFDRETASMVPVLAGYFPKEEISSASEFTAWLEENSHVVDPALNPPAERR